MSAHDNSNLDGLPPEDESRSLDTNARIVGIDAYRGLVMFLMMAEVLRLSEVARRVGDSPFWDFLAYHQSHVAWVGCSLHDLIQPSFSFLVGVAMPFSLASRSSQGQSNVQLVGHAAWRALVLTALGILLRSMHCKQTYFTFEDTLSQIGLGYLPLFMFGMAKPKWTWIGLTIVLAGYFTAFACYPLPATDFDYGSVGVPDDWAHHASGFAAHWNKNSNLAWAFDVWFLNQFPREAPFTHNGGGYATLSFIPTLGTMMLGLIAGRWLRMNTKEMVKIAKLVVAGAICMAIGTAADRFGICPNVKRIWTPTWTLFSGAWCFWFLALFYLICDVGKLQVWAFPLQVIGANSIAAYCLSHLIEHFLITNYKIHFGAEIFQLAGISYEPLLQGSAVLAAYWIILYWMYRRRLFLKI